jgi:glutamyl-tRNA synthetase
MQEQDNYGLAQAFKDSRSELSEIDVNYIEMVVALVKERATFVSDFRDLTNYFFSAPTNYDEKASKKAFKEGTTEILNTIKGLIENIEVFDVENIQSTIKSWITSNEIGFGKVMMPLRLALVGALQGPDVFDIIYMIGKDESIKRIENAINSFAV